MHQNSGCATSTLALALSLKLLVVTVSPSGPAFDEEPVKKVCKVAKALADVEGVALSKITNLINQVSAANEATAKLNLAAASASTANSSTLYAAAAGLATRCSSDAANALTTVAPIASSAATNSTKRSGHISEVIEILRRASKDRTTKKCIVKSVGGAATDAAAVTAYDCPASILDKPDGTQSPDPDVLDDKGFKILSGETTLHSGTSKGSCIFLAGGNDAAAQLWQANGGTGTPVSIAQGFITITPHETATSATAKIPSLAAPGDSWSATDTTTTAKRYNKIGDLTKYKHTSCGDSLDEVLDTILATDKLRAALLAIVKKPKGGGSQANRR